MCIRDSRGACRANRRTATPAASAPAPARTPPHCSVRPPRPVDQPSQQHAPISPPPPTPPTLSCRPGPPIWTVDLVSVGIGNRHVVGFYPSVKMAVWQILLALQFRDRGGVAAAGHRSPPPWSHPVDGPALCVSRRTPLTACASSTTTTPCSCT